MKAEDQKSQCGKDGKHSRREHHHTGEVKALLTGVLVKTGPFTCLAYICSVDSVICFSTALQTQLDILHPV